MRTALLILALVAFAGASCATAPPALTPAAQTAFRTHQVVSALDLLRDVVTEGAAQQPPVFTPAVATAVVRYHQSALRIIQAAPAGWATAVATGLDELKGQLTAADRAQLVPYVSLIQTVLVAVQP